MQRALLVTVTLLPCACEANAPATSRADPPPLASEWGGVLDDASRVPAVPARDFEPTSDAWILHVGDSFVNASFAQNLAPRFRAAGTRQVILSKSSTDTTNWAQDPDLDEWLARRPSLVLVTLGANEVDNLVPKLHAYAVHALARKIGAVASCVWVAPPLWKADGAGWLQVLYDSCAPCLFFDSDAILGGLSDDERRRDGIHPNERGGQRWAGALWDWLEEHRDPSRGQRQAWSLVPFERR